VAVAAVKQPPLPPQQQEQQEQQQQQQQQQRLLIDTADLEYRNVMKTETEIILKYKDPRMVAAHVERKNKCDTSNNKKNWNHLTIIQKIPEQHNRKARNQKTTENSHIGHCTHTL
jgi:hypothetical protein